MPHKRFWWWISLIATMAFWFLAIPFFALADNGDQNLFSDEDVPAPPGDLAFVDWDTYQSTQQSGGVNFMVRYEKTEEGVVGATIYLAQASMLLYVLDSENSAKSYFSNKVSNQRSHLVVLDNSNTLQDEATRFVYTTGQYVGIIGTRYDYDLHKYIIYKNAVIAVTGISKGQVDANSYCDYLEAQAMALVDRKGMLALKTDGSEETKQRSGIPSGRAAAAGAAAAAIIATTAIFLNKTGNGGELDKVTNEDKEFEELLEPEGNDANSGEETKDRADPKVGDSDYDEGEDIYKGGTEEKPIGEKPNDKQESDKSQNHESEETETVKKEEPVQENEQDNQLKEIARIGDVQILQDPNTGKTVISGSNITISKEKDLYGIMTGGKVAHYNTETGEFKITDSAFTFEKDGTTYTVTKDNKIIQYDNFDKVGKISDGHFTIEKEGTTYTVTKDNKVIQYNTVDKVGKISDGRFTFEKDGTTYTVTKDDLVIQYDKSGKIKVSDGCFTLEKSGKLYTVTKENKVITYDSERGVGSVTLPHQTFIFGKGGQFGTEVSSAGGGKVVSISGGFERTSQETPTTGEEVAKKWWIDIKTKPRGIKQTSIDIRYEKKPDDAITKFKVQWKF